MSDDDRRGRPQRWARLRFAIIGPLLAAPPPRGELQAALEELQAKTWRHPVTGAATQFGFSTIERWLYRARAHDDPVGVLRRKVRKDAGAQPSMGARLRQALLAQYDVHKKWSYTLHRDNLAVLVERDASLGRLPSYPTVRRFMKTHGLLRQRRLGPRGRPGVERAEQRLEAREVRSYEAAYVHGLWHADFHGGSLQVLTTKGARQTPQLLGVLDDRSRLCCHAQWYLDENVENFVHGTSQAFQKRGLPREYLSDNGGPMIAAETEEGLSRLSVLHPTTLACSPWQNGKQEVFWAQVEGRLLAMLEGVPDLTLPLLNEATQAWVELEYNRTVHSETHEPPLARCLAGPDVGRPSPASAELRAAFTQEAPRTQRRSDGTITVAGVRFEVPSRFRHVERLTVRYARWDLSYVLLVAHPGGAVLGRLYPLDRTRNADGIRRPLTPLLPTPPAPRPAPGLAPLLEKLMGLARTSGLPPAYVPKDDLTPTDDQEPA
jgi:transposase InsO family protein